MAYPILHEKRKRYSREWLKKNLQKAKDYDHQRDPIKLRARRRIRERVWNGTLKKLPCEVCGEPKTEAHHPDYSKPLEVQWLCAFHHKQTHNGH